MSTNFFEWPAFTTLVDAAGSSIARPKQTPAHSVEATRGRQQRQDSPTAASDGGARSSTTLPSGRTSAPSSAPVSARSVSAEEDLLQFAETDAPPGVSRSATATTATVATQPRRSEAVPLGSPNLFVAELPPSVDDEALEGTFRRFGIIISAKVMLDVHTAVSRGFGFVLFENAVDAAAARDALQGQPVPGHGGKLQISVSRHRGENLTAESRVVYVRNLPVAVGRPRLETYLQRFGRVVKLQLKGSANGAAAVANAVIEFAQPESARAAVAALHGKRPFEPECEIPLLAKLEEPQQLRDQRLQRTTLSNPTTTPISAPSVARVQPIRQPAAFAAPPHTMPPHTSSCHMALSPGVPMALPTCVPMSCPPPPVPQHAPFLTPSMMMPPQVPVVYVAYSAMPVFSAFPGCGY